MSEAQRNELVKLGFLCEAAMASAHTAISSGSDKFWARVAAFHVREAQICAARAFALVSHAS